MTEHLHVPPPTVSTVGPTDPSFLFFYPALYSELTRSVPTRPPFPLAFRWLTQQGGHRRLGGRRSTRQGNYSPSILPAKGQGQPLLQLQLLLVLPAWYLPTGLLASLMPTAVSKLSSVSSFLGFATRLSGVDLGSNPTTQGGSCHMSEHHCPSPQRPSQSGEDKLKLESRPLASQSWLEA